VYGFYGQVFNKFACFLTVNFDFQLLKLCIRILHHFFYLNNVGPVVFFISKLCFLLGVLLRWLDQIELLTGF